MVEYVPDRPAYRTEKALDLLASEREESAQNIRDILSFRDEVGDLTVQAPEATAGYGTILKDNGTTPAEEVLHVYEDIVLDSPGYDAGKRTLVEHLAEDFGRNVAVALANGSFSSPVKEVICAVSKARVGELRRHVQNLDDEEASLEAAKTVVNEVGGRLRSYDWVSDDWLRNPEGNGTSILLNASFDDGTSYLEDIDTMKERCGEAHEKRQNTLHKPGRPTDPEGNGLFMEEYLYEPLQVSHPAMADINALLERVEAARSETVKLLSRAD